MLGADGQLHHRDHAGDLCSGGHPAEVAAALATRRRRGGVVAGQVCGDVPSGQGPAGHGGAQRDGPQPDWAPPLTILHSTSRRYADGGVVLTYAAILDGNPDPAARPVHSQRPAPPLWRCFDEHLPGGISPAGLLDLTPNLRTVERTASG